MRLGRWSMWAGGLIVVAMIVAGFLVWPRFQALRRETALGKLSALNVAYTLTPRDFTEAGVRGEDFGIASSGVVFVSTPKGPVGIAPAGFAAPRRESAVQSLAVGADDAMLTVAGGYLGVLDGSGEALRSVPLPFDNFRVAPSAKQGVVYLFGGEPNDWRLYRFFADGTFALLAQSEAPIVGVAESGPDLLVATPKHVARLSEKGLGVAFEAPDDPAFGPITSIAASSDGLLFVATATKVYAGSGAVLLSVVNNSGGQLRWRDGRLFVLDPRRRLLYSLQPANASMLKG